MFNELIYTHLMNSYTTKSLKKQLPYLSRVQNKTLFVQKNNKNFSGRQTVVTY